MEAKKLLKKHLDIHIPKGVHLSEKQLTQLRYDASIDAINEALNKHRVSETFHSEDDTEYCNKHKWGDCECIEVCMRGFEIEKRDN